MRRTFLSLASLGLCALAAASCGGGSDAESAGTAGETPTAESGATTTSTLVVADVVPETGAPTPTAAPTAAPTVASTEPPTTPPVTVDINNTASCMVNTWALYSEELEDLFTDTQLGSVPGLNVTVAGLGTIEMRADGTYTHTPAYTAQITMLDISSSGQWSGVDEGTWAVDGDTLTMAITSQGVTGSISMNGAEFPLPELRTFQGQGRVVDCNETYLDIEVDTGVGVVSHRLISA